MFNKIRGAFFSSPERTNATGTVVIAVVTTVYAAVSYAQLRVLNKQLDVSISDQQPNVYVNDPGQPVFAPTKQDPSSGQVIWNVSYINGGKSVAKNLRVISRLRLGNESFQLSNGVHEENLRGSSLQPSQLNFTTVISKPGVSKYYFDQLISGDLALGLFAEFDYDDAYGNSHADRFCYSRWASSAMLNINADDCR